MQVNRRAAPSSATLACSELVPNRPVLSTKLQHFTSRVLRIKSSFALQETPVVEAEALVEIQVKHTENMRGESAGVALESRVVSV